MTQFNHTAPVPADNSGGSSPFDQIMLLDHNGQERWSARDLQDLMGYSKWQEFEKVIEKAKMAIRNSDLEPLDHFTGARKVIKRFEVAVPDGHLGLLDDLLELLPLAVAHEVLEITGRPPLLAIVVQEHDLVERTRPPAIVSWDRGSMVELSQGLLLGSTLPAAPYRAGAYSCPSSEQSSPGRHNTTPCERHPCGIGRKSIGMTNRVLRRRPDGLSAPCRGHGCSGLFGSVSGVPGEQTPPVASVAASRASVSICMRMLSP